MTPIFPPSFEEWFDNYKNLHEQQDKLMAQIREIQQKCNESNPKIEEIWEIQQKYHELDQKIEEIDALFKPYWQFQDNSGGEHCQD